MAWVSDDSKLEMSCRDKAIKNETEMRYKTKSKKQKKNYQD